MAIKIGPLEELILLAVIKLEDNAYGVTIQKKLEDVGEKVSEPLLYATLSRLSEKGALSERTGEATPVRGGRRKRLYTVTSTGHAALNAYELEYRAHASRRKLLGVKVRA